MPIIHSSWKLLTTKLKKQEAKTSKRIGDATIIFLVDHFEQDRSIPILDNEILKAYLNHSCSWRTSVAKCTIDELVIKEPEGIEFDVYRDEDEEEEESTLTRNLKKIRTIQKAPPKIESPAKKEAPLKREANWSDTSLKFDAKDYDTVYRDLVLFKDKLRSSEEAKRLAKQLILEYIKIDETQNIQELFKMISSLDAMTTDSEFWEELTLRVKTKLNPHIIFKSKLDREWLSSYYKNFFISIAKYFNETNPSIKLPFETMKQLVRSIPGPIVAKEEKKENTNPVKPYQPDRKVLSINTGTDGKYSFVIQIKPKKEKPDFNPKFS